MLECQSVSLSYDGLRDAVTNLDFTVAAGSIFALVGPNGAGKTSTLRMLATLQQPSRGRITVDGLDAARHAEGVRRRVGYLPDHFALYEQMTPLEYLDFFGRCYDVDETTRRRRAGELLEELDLVAKQKSAIASLSRGMRQRLGVAKTLIHDPKVLLLDEPASALDPGARLKLKEALLRLKARGLAILISSHILPDLAGLADSVGIMEGGRLIRCGAVETMAAARATWVIEVRANVDKALRVFAEFGSRVSAPRPVTPSRFELEVEGGADVVAELVEALVLRGARVAEVAPRESALEAMYRQSAATEVA
ncbi:MAG TPA: ABC transporter ATP-binding protein [Polyangia bacterium]|jgi:ABC-2 type transport system ATP-binding protein|nr:ABC transporter ATP-binding protein [Polyangia bacterium]